jgi:hypothetical protein
MFHAFEGDRLTFSSPTIFEKPGCLNLPNHRHELSFCCSRKSHRVAGSSKMSKMRDVAGVMGIRKVVKSGGCEPTGGKDAAIERLPPMTT